MAESFHTQADFNLTGEHDDAVALNLGESYMFGLCGRVTHVRFRSPVTGAGTHAVGFYKVIDHDPPVSSGAGTLYGNASVTGYVADSWVTQALPTPAPVRVNTVYRSVWWSSVGRYRAIGSFFSSGAITRGNITAIRDNVPTGGFDLHNGTYVISGALAYTKDSFNATTYLVDVVYEPASRIRPTLIPELTADAGLYSFGIDFTVNTPLEIAGVWWYQPSGGTVANVTVRLYTQATQTQLATGSALAASLVVDEWNLIPFAAPYAVSTGTTYTAAAETSGRHAYDNTVSLPTVDPTSRVTMTQTRYESGGGYPTTGWGAGHHGIDIEFAAATAAVVRPRIVVSRGAVHRASRW